MKKFFAIALVSFIPVIASAQEAPKHLISIGTDGLGWSGMGTKFDRDKDKSGIKDQESSRGELNLNYHYIFSSRFMLGAELRYSYENSENKNSDGSKETEELKSSTLALSVGYNFNEDLFNSWWVKAALGGGSLEVESKDTTATPQKTESEIGVGFFTIEAGKRFSFESWGLKNFSYSPSIAFTSASYDEDADDSGLDSSTSFQINILKFDILF